MKVVVIGLGSMGKRRIRLIQKYNHSIGIIGVDLDQDRRVAAEREFAIEIADTLEQAIETGAQCAIICTSPLSHQKLIHTCLTNDLHVFTELNLVDDGYEENISLAKQKGKILFLSSTLLYRSEIKEMKKLVGKHEGCLNYVYHVGQYLPDWHPWEDYKNFFVHEKRTNGCREIFAIELPWIVDVFGPVEELIVRKNKMTSLNLEYPDNYLVILEHASGHKGVLAVDIVSRKAVRNLEVFGEQLYLSWDGSAVGLNVMDIDKQTLKNVRLYQEVDQLGQYNQSVIENAYLDELVCFFESVQDQKEPMYTFEKDKAILELIDTIEA